MKPGQRGGPVFAVQRKLNIWVAKWRLSLPALKEDGVYGKATAERVRAFQQALELAEDLNMRPVVAHCHLGLSRVYRRTGKDEEARKHFSTAMTMYREMGMRFWLEQAAAAMAS